MISRNRNTIIISLLWLSLLGALFNRPEPATIDPICLVQSRKELKTRQLQTSFENMKNQFTPGYRGRILGENGVARIDCRRGKIFRVQTRTNLAINGNGFFCLSGSEGKKLYTRDGRFDFQEGTLRSLFGQAVIGYPLDSKGNICGEETPVKLWMDPVHKLYCGKYTNFKIDEAGTLYGETSLADPTTGQRLESYTPLFRFQLAGFEAPAHLLPVGTTIFEETDLSGVPFLGVAGQEDLGEVKAGSLELSNVDYMEQSARIGKIKLEITDLEEGTLFLRTQLDSESLRILTSKGVAVNYGEGLTCLEDVSKKHLFLALNSAVEAEPDSEVRELLLRAMETLEPRFVRSH